MLESIRMIFEFATSAYKVSEEFLSILKKKKGKARLLFEELKHNQDLIAMVVDEDTDYFKVIPKFETNKYDALLSDNYNFASLSKKKIVGNKMLKKSDLKHFIGKPIGFLIEDIYDKIKEIRRIYEIDSKNTKIDWRRRIINLYKRLILLIYHLRSDQS